jgi:hypothetical protein
MDKRLMKRHKRQVLRAKERVRLSEPDTRTPEQVREAREASRPGGARRDGSQPLYAAPPKRSQTGQAADSATKAGE